MFNPKITPGPWEATYKLGPFWGTYEGKIECEDCVEGNKAALLAVPDLLEVYKAARECLDTCVTYGDLGEKFKYVISAINKLEERHCND